MRTLHLVAGYPPDPGAVARWCQGLCRALARRGHAVEVVTLAPDPEPGFVAWGAADVDEGVCIVRAAASPPLLALHRLAHGRGVALQPRSVELRRLLWQARTPCGAFHVHGVQAPHARWAWFSARAGRRPLVVTPHLTGPGELGRPAVRWLLRRADAVIAVGPGEARWLHEGGVAPKRVVVLDQPASSRAPQEDAGERRAVRARLGLADGDRLLVFAGACDWERGAPTFVDAIRLLRLDGWPAVAGLVGGGSIDPHLRRLWQASQVPVLELPLMPTAERMGVLANAAAVVLPSDWRLGDAVDAWEVNVPALAPGRGDGPAPEDPLMTFPPGDPSALARQMARLLGDPTTASEVVALGRARVAQAPTWVEIAERMEAVYARV